LKRKIDRDGVAAVEVPSVKQNEHEAQDTSNNTNSKKKKEAVKKNQDDVDNDSDSTSDSDSDSGSDGNDNKQKGGEKATKDTAETRAAPEGDPFAGLNSKEKRLLKRQMDRGDTSADTAVAVNATVEPSAMGSPSLASAPLPKSGGTDPYEGLNSKERRLLKRQLERGEAPSHGQQSEGDEAEPKKAKTTPAAESGGDPYAGLNSKEKRLLKRKLDRGEEVDIPEASPAAAAPAAPQQEKAPAQAWPTLPEAPTSTAAEESTRVCVRNLAFNVTEELLSEAFAPAMNSEFDLVSVKWITDKETKKFYGTAFLEFASSEVARRALNENGSYILDRPIVVEATKVPRKQLLQQQRTERPAGEKPPGCDKIFIGNIAYETTEDEAWELFGKCGDVKNLRWLTNKDTGDFRGCGYVEFYDTASVDAAIELGGTELHGRRMRVDYA